MMKRFALAATLACLLLLAATPLALASDGLPDEIVVGEDYTLAAGETLSGNLVVYGGDVELEPGSRVTGDVVIVGGEIEASGEVGGDLVVVGGDAHLTDSAVVGGDLATMGGEVQRDPGAQVRGRDISAPGPEPALGDYVLRIPLGRWVDLANFGLGQFLRSVGWAVTLGVLALLVLVFWPIQSRRVEQAIVAGLLPSFAMGLITALVGGLVFTVLILALCLGLIGWLGLAAAFLFGWIALGSVVGMRLAPALKLTELHPAGLGALGTFLLTLVVEVLGFVPCLGPLLSLLLASLGLGAVILTRFGTRPYLPGTPPMAPVEA